MYVEGLKSAEREFLVDLKQEGENDTTEEEKMETGGEKVTDKIKNELEDKFKKEFSEEQKLEYIKSPAVDSGSSESSLTQGRVSPCDMNSSAFSKESFNCVAKPHSSGIQLNNSVSSGGAGRNASALQQVQCLLGNKTGIGKSPPDFFHKNVVSSQAMSMAPSKCWFSLLPRRPCDETSLTLLHSYYNRGFTPTYSVKADNDYVNPRQPIARPPGRPPKAYNPMAYHQSLMSVLSSGVSPMTTLQGKLLLGASEQLLDSASSTNSSPEKALSTSTRACATACASTVSLSFEELRNSVLESLRQEPAPIPPELQHGWWRITEPSQLKELTKALHTR